MNNLPHTTATPQSPGANQSVSAATLPATHGQVRMSYSSGNHRRGTGRSQIRRTSQMTTTERMMMYWDEAVKAVKAGNEILAGFYENEIEELVGLSA